MSRFQRAVELGWVTECSNCAEGRRLLQELKEWRVVSRHCNTTAHAVHADKVSIACEGCEGRGWNVTPEGRQLVDIMKEAYPDVVAVSTGEEIPF